ncbi:unnamed protein product [Linum tenue]|uniref:Uncharacterized protein n=1 Tax=Linum tenue TaxID=586396 RepID=A0AAV0GX57_9ROSI|nr:unnamed protein product [Linum tenue]
MEKKKQTRSRTYPTRSSMRSSLS